MAEDVIIEELIKKIPSWLFAIAVAVFVGMLVHSLFVSGRPFQIFGQPFGAIAEVGSPVPSGAVIAFESECAKLGPGWTTYAPATARVIVGAGSEFHPKHQEWFMQLPQGGEERKELEPYAAERSGGELAVMLSVEEMPSHSHPILRTDSDGDGNFVKWTAMGSPNNRSTGTGTKAVGGGQTHNNMPPYLALYFCKKD